MNLNQNIILYTLAGFTIILSIWNIIQYFSIRKIKKKQSILFQGKTAKDLEEIILAHQNNLSSLNNQFTNLSKKVTFLEELANAGLNKVGMVRFNPFKNLGGNQSFAIAFLNSHHNGLIISSIYSNDGSRLYSKTIMNGTSQKEFPLTEEEKKAISIAIGKE